MKKILIIILLLVIFLQILCSKINTSQEIRPIAKEGILDLKNIVLTENEEKSWIFGERGYFELDGDWNFYWNELLSPEGIVVRSGLSAKTLRVPGSWNDFEVGGNKVNGFGYGTYSLRVILPKSLKGKILTLKIPHVGTAYNLYIDNLLFAKNGEVGKSFEEMTPQYLTITKSFIVPDESFLITMQISNFHHRKGGIRFDSIVLGLESQVQILQEQSTIYVYFLMGSILIMAFYHLGLFLLRREDITAFIFGIFCLLVATRLLFVGDVWITALYPEMNWDWMYKMEYISLYFSAPAFSLFTYNVFRTEFHKRVLYFTLPIYGILSLMVILTKPVIFSLALPIFQLVAVLNSFYVLYVIIRAVRNKKEGAIAALIGFTFFLITIPNDLLYNYNIILTGYTNLLPLGVYLFIFCQSFILSQIFANAFKSVKILSNNLILTNEAYSRFVPVEFLKYLNKKSIMDIQLGDQMQKEMAILFSDIRSFTDLSEKLTPKENFNFLNSYLKRMSPVIQKNNGFIDKYIGDAIMALFPGSVEDAINAGIDMQKEIRVYNQHRLKMGYDPIKVGCGIHSGNLMLGIIGADARMEGTVIADSVNVASRIERLTKVYDVTILISDTILQKIEDITKFNFRYIDKVKVKGKSQSTTIYEIYDGQPDFMIELKNQSKTYFENGINFYYDKNFKEAIISFSKVIDINPNDTASEIYLKRAKYYLENGILEFLE